MFACRLSFVVACVATAAAVTAQDYSFSVPEMQMFVEVNPDAAVAITYYITFSNNPGAHAIDVVDVGLPHRDYDLSTMSATIDGQACGGISKSEYVDIGVQVPLGGYQIPQGKTGKFTFECVMPNLVYQDTTRKDYASLQITPTWFDGRFLTGTTDLQVAVSAPEGVKPDELLYQKKPFTKKAILGHRAVAYWRWEQARVDAPHMVGLSFPKRGMTRVVHMSAFQLLAKWFNDQIVQPFVAHEEYRIFSGVAFAALLTFLWYRFSGGTGGCLVVLLLIGAIAIAVQLPAAHLLSWPPLVGLVYLNERCLSRRKKHYLPPIISVEGGGIKRGLTAPEAAILLELPLNKVLTLVMFGLLKKGVVRTEWMDPLQLKVEPESSPALEGLHPYERPFLRCLEEHPGEPVVEIDFEVPMNGLILETAKKMKSFNLEETREYYRSIISKAWAEAEAMGEIPEREKSADENLDWLLMTEDYDDRFNRWRSTGYDYHPSWTRTTTPVPSPTAPSPAPSAPGGTTGFRDVASSFAGWAENLMGNTVVKIDAASLASQGGGVVNLSGLDKVTGEFFKAMAEASSSGGGGGGGCACAGCACACACAGGGR